MEKKVSAEKAVREIRRKTRRRFSAEEKIRIVIEGLRCEESIASLCRSTRAARWTESRPFRTLVWRLCVSSCSPQPDAETSNYNIIAYTSGDNNKGEE